jgi:hypothetical protein
LTIEGAIWPISLFYARCDIANTESLARQKQPHDSCNRSQCSIKPNKKKTRRRIVVVEEATKKKREQRYKNASDDTRIGLGIPVEHSIHSRDEYSS